MLMGTVPLIDAVTEPICAVPAASAGSELIVRLFPTVTVPPTVTALARSWVLVRDASEQVTACDAGKLRTDTDPVTLGVPEIEIGPTHTLVPLTALVMSVMA